MPSRDELTRKAEATDDAATKDELCKLRTRLAELEGALREVRARTYSSDNGCELKAAAVAAISEIARKALEGVIAARFHMERHDDEDGSINYEIWDYDPQKYRRVATVSERLTDTALTDARMIVNALNASRTTLSPAGRRNR